jgi:ArsR family transcriptional regulator, arsenate/arsenite/antimonite-responsive transcriptional repressor
MFCVTDSPKTQLRNLFFENLDILNALGDQTRQQIIMFLGDSAKPMTVKELSLAMYLPRPTVSHHLKVMMDAKLLSCKIDGTKRYYYPTISSHAGKIKKLLDLIEQVELTIKKER